MEYNRHAEETMSDLQVQLPESTREFIDQLVRAGIYRSPSELITVLVEDARGRVASQELDRLLDEGEQSGHAVEFTDEWWQAEKAALLARLPKGDAQ
jgi:putative addiction module CopG family antidote